MVAIRPVHTFGCIFTQNIGVLLLARYFDEFYFLDAVALLERSRQTGMTANQADLRAVLKQPPQCPRRKQRIMDRWISHHHICAQLRIHFCDL